MKHKVGVKTQDSVLLDILHGVRCTSCALAAISRRSPKKKPIHVPFAAMRTVIGEPTLANSHLSPQGDTRGSKALPLAAVVAAAAVVLAAAGGGAGAVAVVVAAAAVAVVACGGGDGFGAVTVVALVGAGVGVGPPLPSTATAARMQSVNAMRHTCNSTAWLC